MIFQERGKVSCVEMEDSDVKRVIDIMEDVDA